MKQDLWSIIEEMEAVVADGMHIPLSDRVVISEQEMYSLLDELRAAMPDELAQARSIVEERERLLSQARSEAERMVAESKAYADELTAESNITARAEEEAHKTVERADEAARKIRVEAHRYADDVLRQLQEILEKASGTVSDSRKGLRASIPEGAAAREAAAAASEGEGSSPRRSN